MVSNELRAKRIAALIFDSANQGKSGAEDGDGENSNLGISFNVLSKYSDEKFRKKNLYYADPKEIIEYCAQNLSDRLILDHSYDQFDMTVTVGKKIVLVSK